MMTHDDATATATATANAPHVSTTRYQLRDEVGDLLSEGEFESIEVASAWTDGQTPEPGWTLFEQVGIDWVAARHDPTPSRAEPAGGRQMAGGRTTIRG